MRKEGNNLFLHPTGRESKLDYIDFLVPVSSIFIPCVFGGLYVSLLIKAKGDFEWCGKHGIRTADQYRKIAHGLKYGIGMEIGKIMSDGRYDFGVSEINIV